MIAKLRNKKVLPIVSLSLITFLAGCTPSPYTGQEEASRTGIGAGVGAAGGALLGQIIGRNTASTLIGAGVGTVAGGLIGNYMDRQASELRSQLQGTGVSVVKTGNDIQLVMPGDITFATNQSTIKPQFYNVLNSVALVLKKYNRTIVKVTGYTDNTGTATYNQQLSEQRAQSVTDYLTSQGVDSNRFSVVGYGERYPIASNQSAAGRAHNRRVQITLHQIN